MPILPFDRDEVLRKNPHLRAGVAELKRVRAEMERAGWRPTRSAYRLDPVLGGAPQVEQQTVHLINQASHLGE